MAEYEDGQTLTKKKSQKDKLYSQSQMFRGENLFLGAKSEPLGILKKTSWRIGESQCYSFYKCKRQENHTEEEEEEEEEVNN